MKAFKNKRYKRERGASLVEYALLVALISVMTMASAQAVGVKTESSFTRAYLGLEWGGHDGEGRCGAGGVGTGGNCPAPPSGP